MADTKVKATGGASAGREAALLRATLENMAQGVAMYDADHKLVTWNSLFWKYLEMPDEFLGTDRTFSDYIRYIGARGEFGEGADIEPELHRRLAMLDRSHSFERVRPDGTVLEVRRDPVPGAGLSPSTPISPNGRKPRSGCAKTKSVFAPSMPRRLWD